MAEKSTIARPYAQAAFEIASDSGNLKGWSEMLQLLSMVAADELMQDIISNPAIERDKVVDVILGVCGDGLNEAGKSFVNVLAENNRLNVMSEIAVLFEKQRAEAEKTVHAEVISAFPLSDAQKQNLIDALKKRLGKEVTLVTSIDASIVGGAIVRAGDLVIDGSVSGQLEKLATALMH